MKARAANTRRRTRIQRENERRILDAALDSFSRYGYRGATIDRIAEAAGMSKPNLLYYFATKEAIHRRLIERLLETWLEPLRALDPDGDPVTEIRAYVRRKIEMARDYPRESRLFANEILHGAQHVGDILGTSLKELVDEKAAVINQWALDGRIARVDPYHLIFAIWATTQHYADFDSQIRAVLGEKLGNDTRFRDGARFLDHLFVKGLSGT